MVYLYAAWLLCCLTYYIKAISEAKRCGTSNIEARFLFIMKESKKISSLSDYLMCVNDAHNIYNPECDLEFRQSRLYYRGQANTEWSTITASLMRKNLVHCEHDMLRDAQNMLWSELAEYKTYIEKIIYFQHYGLPTRLLDISTNPLIALYFACADYDDKDGVVYYGYVKNENINAVNGVLEFVFENEVVDYLPQKYSNEEKTLFSIPYFIHPPLNNPRIKQQMGEFLIAPITNDKREILNTFDFSPCFEGKIIIPHNSKLFILNELDECGINEATIYLDAASQLRYIANKYTPKYKIL